MTAPGDTDFKKKEKIHLVTNILLANNYVSCGLMERILNLLSELGTVNYPVDSASKMYLEPITSLRRSQPSSQPTSSLIQRTFNCSLSFYSAFTLDSSNLFFIHSFN